MRLPILHAETNPECFFFTPGLYFMAGEDARGEPDGTALVLSWLCFTLSLQWE